MGRQARRMPQFRAACRALRGTLRRVLQRIAAHCSVPDVSQMPGVLIFWKLCLVKGNHASAWGINPNMPGIPYAAPIASKLDITLRHAQAAMAWRKPASCVADMWTQGRQLAYACACAVSSAARAPANGMCQEL